MTAGPGWELALERAASLRLTMLVGDADAGKTSLATFLANGLFPRGFRIGVVDADLGQSEIGPPTTIGLGRVTRVLARLAEAEVAGLSFVGSTSPQGHVASTVAGTRQMVERAATLGLERIIVDTSGLIGGPLGRTLKQRKIEALDPDLLICLERDEECEPVRRPYEGRGRPEILRLPIGEQVRSRSAAQRRRHREAALDAYFQGAARRHLSLPGLAVRVMADGGHEPAPLDRGESLERAVVGLDDGSGDTLGLGAVRAVGDRTLLIDTPVRDAHVAGLRLGRQGLRPIEPVR